MTRAQREALLDEFERSGLKGLPFARMTGVNYQMFASWVQKRRHKRGDYEAARGRPGLVILAEMSSEVVAAAGGSLHLGWRR